MTTTHTEAAVQVTVDGHIARVALNQPHNRNAFSDDLMDGLLAAIEELNDNDQVRVVVVTGNGGTFSVGGDLSKISSSETKQVTLTTRTHALRSRVRVVELLRSMNKVTIAAINGACAGAGLSLALACDLRYASETAKFSTAFLTAGLSGDFGVTWFLPRLIGSSAAKELLFEAEKFTADRAQELGLVNQVVPADSLDELVQSKAKLFAGRAPAALQLMKQAINRSEELDLGPALDREIEGHVWVATTDDCREAAAAFMEKRTPVFTGA